VLLDGAKKEGEVVLYTGMVIEQGINPIAKAFNEKYPGIEIKAWRGDINQMMAKINAEARAGKPIGDLAEGGNVSLHLNQAKLAQKFISPESKAYARAYIAADGTWVTTRLGYYGVAYNTKLVAAADVPKTYDDLLNPKWKGKMAWRSGSESGSLTFIMNILMAKGDQAGEEYLKALAKNDLVNYSQSANQLVDQVGQGEYPMALNAAAHSPIIARGLGAPLDTRMLDPIPINTMPLAMIRNAPHPHAAMLLLDFLISQKGQEILRDANYFSAHPAVEPLAEMAAITPRAVHMKENVIPPEMFVEKRSRLKEIEDRYFK
jgi:ABC-type Fe3+ transport system substrate-binding protein